MTEPTPKDWLEARHLMAKYQAAAKETVEMLLKAYDQGEPSAGAWVVQQVFDRQDVTFTMLVIGQLVTRVVNAERRAQDPSGPMLTPKETGLTEEPITPWETAVVDQVEAAIGAGDFQGGATVAVAAHMKSLDLEEVRGVTVDFNYLFRAMLMLNQQAVSLEAAEMMRQLREIRRGR